MKVRIHHNPRLGNSVEFKELCEETKGTRTVAEITLQPHGGIPLHYHHEFSEYYEVLDGELAMVVGNETRQLKKGEYVMIQPKTNPRYFNPGFRPVKFKVVIQPGNFGYQVLIAILNGLAREGKVDKNGLPRSLMIKAYLSVSSGSNIPKLALFQPLFNWLHRLAVRKGIDKELLDRYY